MNGQVTDPAHPQMCESRPWRLGPETGDPRPATRDLRPATRDPRPATCNLQPATHHGHTVKCGKRRQSACTRVPRHSVTSPGVVPSTVAKRERNSCSRGSGEASIRRPVSR